MCLNAKGTTRDLRAIGERMTKDLEWVTLGEYLTTKKHRVNY